MASSPTPVCCSPPCLNTDGCIVTGCRAQPNKFYIKPDNVKTALLYAQSALRRWTDLYAHLQNECGDAISRKLDYNLPPADHLRALEAIAEALSTYSENTSIYQALPLPPQPGTIITTTAGVYPGAMCEGMRTINMAPDAAPPSACSPSKTFQITDRIGSSPSSAELPTTVAAAKLCAESILALGPNPSTITRPSKKNPDDGFTLYEVHARACAKAVLDVLRTPSSATMALSEHEAVVASWKSWAEYACRRFREETGKDLQAEATT